MTELMSPLTPGIWHGIRQVVVDGRLLADRDANRSLLESLVAEDQNEVISVSWFKNLLAENPNYASRLIWESADVLNPAKRRQAEANQDEEDRRLFNEFAREHGFSEVEANFQLAKSVLEEGFGKYALAQAIQSNALQLAPASPTELARYSQKAQEERVGFLVNRATPQELRATAKAEAEQHRSQATQQQVAQQIQIREAQDASVGYPALPELNSDGVKLDRVFLLRLADTNIRKYKQFCSKYGMANITARLNGVR